MESPFVGDSEMARRMREVDWAGTPLGPPRGWPAALQTAVTLLLRSQLPMYVAAGPEWSLLYNDAYAPMLGVRHPDALAAPFAATWPEVWPGVAPALADALWPRVSNAVAVTVRGPSANAVVSHETDQPSKPSVSVPTSVPPA